MEKVLLSWDDVENRAKAFFPLVESFSQRSIKVYGIPNGGIYAAQAVLSAFYQCSISNKHLELVEKPEDADVYVDDIIDSGRTKDKLFKESGEKPFFVLVDKNGKDSKLKGIWVDFPWERMEKRSGIEENIVRILQYIGEDPQREGLQETPARVIKSYSELFAGYNQKPEDIFKTFDNHRYDEIVLCKDIPFCSTCEHHLMGFVGIAHVAYLPNKRVIGLSKLSRLVDIYARRLQIQERMTIEITDALNTYLKPHGAACVLKASHSCMSCRGVMKHGSTMVTSSLTGEFLKPEVRAEFFSLTRD